MDETRTFAYEPIALDALSATDLRAEARAYLGDAEPDEAGTRPIAAFRVTIIDPDGMQRAERADILVIEDRIGIAWGATADWGYGIDHSGESPSGPNALEEAIDCWLNRGDEWEARN